MKDEIAKEIVDELRLIREELQNLTMAIRSKVSIGPLHLEAARLPEQLTLLIRVEHQVPEFLQENTCLGEFQPIRPDLVSAA